MLLTRTVWLQIVVKATPGKMIWGHTQVDGTCESAFVATCFSYNLMNFYCLRNGMLDYPVLNDGYR